MFSSLYMCARETDTCVRAHTQARTRTRACVSSGESSQNSRNSSRPAAAASGALQTGGRELASRGHTLFAVEMCDVDTMLRRGRGAFPTVFALAAAISLLAFTTCALVSMRIDGTAAQRTEAGQLDLRVPYAAAPSLGRLLDSIPFEAINSTSIATSCHICSAPRSWRLRARCPWVCATCTPSERRPTELEWPGTSPAAAGVEPEPISTLVSPELFTAPGIELPRTDAPAPPATRFATLVTTAVTTLSPSQGPATTGGAAGPSDCRLHGAGVTSNSAGRNVASGERPALPGCIHATSTGDRDRTDHE